MKTFAFITAATFGLGIAGTSVTQAGHDWGGYQSRRGIYGQTYSVPQNWGYSNGWYGVQSHFRPPNIHHYDFHPGGVRHHSRHMDYVPSHYDRHPTGHFGGYLHY